VLVVVAKEAAELVVADAAGDVEGPEGAEFSGDVGVGVEDALEFGAGGFVEFSGGVAFLQEATGVPNVPIVFVELEVDEFGVGKLCEVEGCTSLSLTLSADGRNRRTSLSLTLTLSPRERGA